MVTDIILCRSIFAMLIFMNTSHIYLHYRPVPINLAYLKAVALHFNKTFKWIKLFIMRINHLWLYSTRYLIVLFAMNNRLPWRYGGTLTRRHGRYVKHIKHASVAGGVEARRRRRFSFARWLSEAQSSIPRSANQWIITLFKGHLYK